MEEKGWKLGPPFLILFKAEEMSHSVRAHARAPPTYRASSRARRADT